MAELYKYLKTKGVTSKTEEEFYNSYPERKDAVELYNYIVDKGVTEKSLDQFYKDNFPQGSIPENDQALNVSMPEKKESPIITEFTGEKIDIEKPMYYTPTGETLGVSQDIMYGTNIAPSKADQQYQIKSEMEEYLAKYLPNQPISTIFDESVAPGTDEFIKPGVELAKKLNAKIASATGEEKKKLQKAQEVLAGAIALGQSDVTPYGVETPTAKTVKGRGKIEEAKTRAEQSRLAQETGGTTAQALFPRLFDAVKNDKNALNYITSSIQDIFGIPGNIVAGYIAEDDFAGLTQRMGVKPEDRRARDVLVMELGNVLNYIAPSGVKAAQIEGKSLRKALDFPREMAETAFKLAKKAKIGKEGSKLRSATESVSGALNKTEDIYNRTVGRLGEAARSRLGSEDVVKSMEASLTGSKYDLKGAATRALIQAGYEDAPELIVRGLGTLTDGDDNEMAFLTGLLFQGVTSPLTKLMGQSAKSKARPDVDFAKKQLERGGPMDEEAIETYLQRVTEGSNIPATSKEFQADNIKEGLVMLEKLLTTDKIKAMDQQLGDNLVDITPVVEQMYKFVKANEGVDDKAARKILSELNSLKARIRKRGGEVSFVSESGDVLPTSVLSTASKLKGEFSQELKDAASNLKFEENALMKLDDKLETADNILARTRESIEAAKKSGIEPEELNADLDILSSELKELQKESNMSLTKYKSIFGEYATPSVMKKDLKVYQNKAWRAKEALKDEMKALRKEIKDFKKADEKRVESDVFQAEIKEGDAIEDVVSLEAQRTQKLGEVEEAESALGRAETQSTLVDEAVESFNPNTLKYELPFKEAREAIYKIKNDVFDNFGNKATNNAELYKEQVWKPLRNNLTNGLTESDAKFVDDVLAEVEETNARLFDPLRGSAKSTFDRDKALNLSKKIDSFVAGDADGSGIVVATLRNVSEEWKDVIRRNAQKQIDDLSGSPKEVSLKSAKILENMKAEIEKADFLKNALWRKVWADIADGNYDKAKGTLARLSGTKKSGKREVVSDLSSVIARSMMSSVRRLGARKGLEIWDGMKDYITTPDDSSNINLSSNPEPSQSTMFSNEKLKKMFPKNANPKVLMDSIMSTASKLKMPRDLANKFPGLISQESLGEESVKANSTSATGLGQLTKGAWSDALNLMKKKGMDTANMSRVNAKDNLEASAIYLLDKYEKYGDVDKALMAYHSGNAAVNRAIAMAKKAKGDWKDFIGKASAEVNKGKGRTEEALQKEANTYLNKINSRLGN